MPDLRSWFAWRTLLAALVVAATCSSAVPALAQGGYKSDPVDQKYRRSGTRSKRFAKSPTTDTQDRADFSGYVQKYYLPMMTRPEPESLALLSKLRYEFFRNYIWGADPSIQRALTPLVLKKMTKIAGDHEYHPSVRYNAVLMIGLLDETYATGGQQSKPLPDANTWLTQRVQQGIKEDVVPASLLVGALVGLERHAKALKPLPAENRTATVDALLAVMATEGLPQDVSRKVTRWIQVIAARGLANAGSLGEGAKVHEAFFVLIGDEDFRLSNRVQIAALLDHFDEAYKSAAGIDDKQAVEALVGLATAIAADEKAHAEKHEERSLSSGGFGDFEGMPSEYQVRRLVTRLRGLQTALRAVTPAIQDENLRTPLSQIATWIGPVLAIAEDKDVRELTLAGDVKLMADSIEQIAESLGVETPVTPEVEQEAEEEEIEADEEEAAADDAPADNGPAPEDQPADEEESLFEG